MDVGGPPPHHPKRTSVRVSFVTPCSCPGVLSSTRSGCRPAVGVASSFHVLQLAPLSVSCHSPAPAVRTSLFNMLAVWMFPRPDLERRWGPTRRLCGTTSLPASAAGVSMLPCSLLAFFWRDARHVRGRFHHRRVRRGFYRPLLMRGACVFPAPAYLVHADLPASRHTGWYLLPHGRESRFSCVRPPVRRERGPAPVRNVSHSWRALNRFPPGPFIYLKVHPTPRI